MILEPSPRTPKRGRYLIQNPAGAFLLGTIDRCLSLLQPFRKKLPLRIPTPRKILLSNGAHLGDILISTGILRLLKEVFPDATLGFLTGSWSRHVLVDHPLIDHLHIVDHWKLNRSRSSLPKKIVRFAKTSDVAEREMIAVGYDVAFELYPFFPNNIPLIHRARIPVRIGYASGGFGPLLTHSLHWNDENNRSVLWHQKELVGTFFSIQEKSFAPFIYPDHDHSLRILTKLAEQFPLNDPYIIFHMGTGSSLKEWGQSRWSDLVDLFSKLPYRIILTGVGEREKQNVETLLLGNSSGPIVNLCDQLDWREFVAVIQGARLLITVDSVAGHVAAATKTPCAIIGTGQNPPLA